MWELLLGGVIGYLLYSWIFESKSRPDEPWAPDEGFGDRLFEKQHQAQCEKWARESEREHRKWHRDYDSGSTSEYAFWDND